MKKHEVHNLICEALVEALNAEGYPGGQLPPAGQQPAAQTPEQIEYAKGVKAGLRARMHGGKYVLDSETLRTYHTAFIKGYKKGTGESWWNNFNDKLANLAGRIGYSRTRPF